MLCCQWTPIVLGLSGTQSSLSRGLMIDASIVLACIHEYGFLGIVLYLLMHAPGGDQVHFWPSAGMTVLTCGSCAFVWCE
jgi:hypothetical protein